jgi:imidazole glycerol-phosphate synthase subunit HisF
VLGGAGSLNDLRLLVQRYPIIGAAAGTLFVLKGKHRAVLINYPEREVRDSFLSAHRS